jgi:hypothetical protein
MPMKKLIRLCLYATVLAVLFSTSAANPLRAPGQSGVVHIDPNRDDIVYVSGGEQAIISWGWGACSKGLTNDYREAVRQRYLLVKDGLRIQRITAGTRDWPRPAPADGPKELCIWPAPYLWRTEYTSPPLNLPSPGTYQLRVTIWLLVPVIDGGDWDQDGHADWFGTEPVERAITIIKS